MINNKSDFDLRRERKGKTYEEFYGIEKANEIKEKMSLRGKNRIYTTERNKKVSDSLKKLYSTTEMKELQSKRIKNIYLNDPNTKMGFKKGHKHKIWNKGLTKEQDLRLAKLGKKISTIRKIRYWKPTYNKLSIQNGIQKRMEISKQRGYYHSPETIQKLRESNINKPHQKTKDWYKLHKEEWLKKTREVQLKRRKEIEVICNYCGSKFYKKLYTFNSSKNHYCSVNCHNVHSKLLGQNRGINNPNFKGGGIMRICPTCNKEFQTNNPSDKRKYCSKKCIKTINKKIKGTLKERKARDELRKEGYLVVRSSGSLSAFDIVAISKEHMRLIQIKATNNTKIKTDTLFKKTIDEIEKIEVPSNAIKELWVWRIRMGWEKNILNTKISQSPSYAL
jgi:hypothetical protein